MRLRPLLACTLGTVALGAVEDEAKRAPHTPPPTPVVSETVVVEGRADDLVGVANSASSGVVGRDELALRPLLRPGEVLETVPGLIATQHSGTGKANQYFLRGFNLDHGTDFATWLDGMPVNMPTHAHGHGYTDLNFLIPEIIDTVTYRKGVYDAGLGDFSSAGSADIALNNDLDHGLAQLTISTDSYQRAVVADSPRVGAGRLLYALEVEHYSGPWQNSEDLRKLNGVLRYNQGTPENGWSVTAMAYRNRWDSTDQIPQRVVEAGTLDRLGTIDPSDGGESSRYSLSGAWRIGDPNQRENQSTVVSAYAIHSKLELFSNFTYFLDDPVHGDQFEQNERRVVLGGAVVHR